MKSFFYAVALAVAVAVAVTALAPALAGAQNQTDASNVVYSKDVPIVPMAEWEIEQRGAAEQTGARILIAAGHDELAKAPANAARYDSQTFQFPGGNIRVLKFTRQNGGVLHQITTETQLYVIKGSATVGVRGEQVAIGAGDVVNLPSGVLRSLPGKAVDTTILAYTVGSAMRDTKAGVIRAKDTPEAAIGAGEKSGVAGAKVFVRRYAYDGNSIRVARLTGKGQTTPATPKEDVLIFLLSGRMQITIGDEVKTVAAGDALREQMAKPTHWDVYENSSFIATNAPKAAAP